MAWIAAVSLALTAEPAELFRNFAKAWSDGARTVMFWAIAREEGKKLEKAVRLVRFGLPAMAAVKFIVCAEAVAAKAARERTLNCMTKAVLMYVERG